MPSEVTLLLQRYRKGEDGALDELTRMIYPELKAMARRRTRGSGDMGATTLVNETFLKLLSGGALQPEDRQQFFGLAAHIMRQVVVDEVRYAVAQKRSGDEVTFSETQHPGDGEDLDFLLEVDRMLTKLAEEDPRLAQVFECRYFAGFSTSETAEASGLSVRTVERLWSLARDRIAERISRNSR